MARVSVQNKLLPHLAQFRRQAREQAIARFEDMPLNLRRQLAYERYQDAQLMSDRGQMLHDVMIDMRHRVEAGDTTLHPDMLRQEVEKLLERLPVDSAKQFFGGSEAKDILQCIAGEANRMALIQLGEKLVEMPSLQDQNAQRAIERMVLVRDALAHPGFSQTDCQAIVPHQALENLRSHLAPAAEREARTAKQIVAAVPMYSSSNITLKGLHQALCRHEIAVKDIIHSAEKAEPEVKLNKAVMSKLKQRRNGLSHALEGTAHSVSNVFSDPDLKRGRGLGGWVKLAEDRLVSQPGLNKETRLFPTTVSHAGNVVGKYTAALVEVAENLRGL